MPEQMQLMAEPYGWVIEYTPHGEPEWCGTVFIRNAGLKDRAHVELRATDLHGRIVELYTRQRKE